MQPNSLDTPPVNRMSDPEKVIDEPYNLFDLDLDDNTLFNACVKELPLDVDYWNEKPWRLKETDEDNVQYYLGQQLDENKFLPHQAKYIDNRLFTSTRAIIAYVFGRLAKPDITPSKGDDKAIRLANQLELAIYQHGLNHGVNAEFRTAGKNMIIRKRGFIKLRFDENCGPFGDIITESIDPSDIVVDRFARLGDNPNRIFHRQKCTVEELIAAFPDKEKEIRNFYGIVQGRYSQMSRMVTYYECWFTFYKDGLPQEGVCWFIPQSRIILDKMRNPNWDYTGSLKQQKIRNLTDYPIKPFIPFNYLNTGRSYIDETSLFDQAKPQQDLLNKRGRQIWENADYANPRILIDKRVMDQADADKFVNKHPKTIGLVDTTDTQNDIGKAVMVIQGTQLPAYAVNTLYDSRNEIDNIMGTPSQFRGGENEQAKSPTLGQDLLIKQQAGALQDDIVEIVNEIYAKYYEYLVQMMKVYLSDDYWVLTKGTSGQYVPILLNSDNIDTNVKIGVQTDSTLPLDKQGQRSTAMQLAQGGLIDPLTLFRDLGLPDAEERAERLHKFQIDKAAYGQSVEQQLYDAEADADITLLIANKVPEDRDNYSEDYLNHFNEFLTTNAFQKLKPDQQQRVTNYLHVVADKAAMTAHLKGSMLNPAGMLDMQPAVPAGPPGQPPQPGAPQPGSPLPGQAPAPQNLPPELMQQTPQGMAPGV